MTLEMISEEIKRAGIPGQSDLFGLTEGKVQANVLIRTGPMIP